MCELCIAGTLTICEPVKGWDLVVAQRDGMLTQIRKGDFGLVDQNNYQEIGIIIPKEVMPTEPHFTWEEFTNRDRPSREDLSDIEYAKEDKLMEHVAHFAREIQMKADTLSAIADLVASAIADGFNNEGELFDWWLSARLGKAMQENADKIPEEFRL